MHPLETQTLKLIARDRLLRPGSPVLAAVSAGPDSMALLHVLAALAPRLGISLAAMYIDHRLRPAETGREEAAVREAAARLRTGFRTVPVDTREYAAACRLSLEHAARDLRYDRLRQAAAEIGAQAIAVAHTADDQAEEVLLRLLRGSGRKGLAGMTTRRGDIVRPFLRTVKADILEYLRERHITFHEDSMNNDLRFPRNRIRLKLLPYLEQHYDPGIRQALRKTADNLAEDETLLEELTDQALARIVLPEEVPSGAVVIMVDRRGLLDLPRALQRRVIEQLLWRIGGRAAHVQIMAILEGAEANRGGAELHLPRGLRVGIRDEYLEFVFPRGKTAWRGRLYPETTADEVKR